MYIYLINPTYKIRNLLKDTIYLIFKPLEFIGNFYRVVKKKIDDALKLSDDSKKKIRSILIVIPIIIIILLLLSSADMIFSSIFNNVFNILKKISIENLIGRIILIIILFTYMGAQINYILFGYKEDTDSKNEIKIETYTIKLLLTLLNITYIIFDFIQIRSLIFHQVSTNINYAQYARSGFFQLMFISLINLSIILISKKSKEDTKYNKVMSIIMILLTFVIIISSFLRMYMYESAYGYTLLRLLVYVILITEAILFIPTIICIINPKQKILKTYIFITITIYTMLSLYPVDYFIANNNINRYYKTGKIDISYLKNHNTDNIPMLCELYNKLENIDEKNNLKLYLQGVHNNNQIKSIQEYNISKKNAIKSIEKCLNYEKK